MTKEIEEVNAYAVAETITSEPPPGSAAVTGLGASPGSTAGMDLAAPPGSAATIPAGGDVVPMGQQAKVGAKCCGCCCDYRRAVIVVASIGIALTVISLISSLSAISAASSTASYYTDDVYMDDGTVQDAVNYGVGVVVILAILGVSASVCALVGAIRFNIWLVVVNVVWLSCKYSPPQEQQDFET